MAFAGQKEMRPPGHSSRGELERQDVGLWAKCSSVCLAHQGNVGPGSFLHTEAPITSTHKVRREA